MRPSKDEYFLNMAKLTSTRGTCSRREVGCVFVDVHGYVSATGYNGVARGQEHCNEGHECKGSLATSGTNLDWCEAIHAEQNALLQCKNIHEIETAYCTTAPCITCAKLLLNTSCKRIVFLETYPHAASKELWEGAGRAWNHAFI